MAAHKGPASLRPRCTQGGSSVAALSACLPVLPPGKIQYPLYRRLGVPQGWSGWVWKILPPLGFNPQTVQPVASCYTDWAILAPVVSSKHTINICGLCPVKFSILSLCTTRTIPQYQMLVIHPVIYLSTYAVPRDLQKRLRSIPTCRKCGTDVGTSVHILCECEILASLRHAHLGSFFLDPEDIRKLSVGATWNFGKGTELLEPSKR
jgi:hypothetical protein